MQSTIDIEGIELPPIEVSESYALVLARATGSTPGLTRVAWLNAHCANIARADARYRDALAAFDFVFNDGIGVDLAARMQGKRFPSNLNGTDWIPGLFDRLTDAQGAMRRVFLLGATAESLAAACRTFHQRWPALTLAGSHSGFFDEPGAVLEAIAESGAGVLLVGMGVPRQELFLADHGDALRDGGVRLAMAGGAILDFLGGTVARAPGLIRSLKMEWVWRLALEPRRMFRRYVVGNPEFLYHALRHTRRVRAPGED